MGFLAACLCNLYVVVLAFEPTRCPLTRQHFFYDGLGSIPPEQSRTVKFCGSFQYRPHLGELRDCWSGVVFLIMSLRVKD